MAHGLKKKNDMVYNSLNPAPWHGLGVPLGGLATVQEVMAACPALAAEVEKVPQVRNGKELDGLYWTVRKDTDTVLGSVGSRYKVLSNLDAFRFMDRLTQDPNGPKYETAGVLWGGSTVFLLAVLPEFIEIVPGDVLRPYILLTNSHDGSGAVRVQETPVRVVCNNTLQMALGGTGRRATVRHTGDILGKVQDVQDALGIVRARFEDTAQVFRALAQAEPTEAQVTEVLQRLIPETATKRAELQRARVLDLAREGAGNAAVRGTAWALYNGFTEMEDHLNGKDSTRPDAQDARVYSVLLDSAAKRKAEALSVIREVCLA